MRKKNHSKLAKKKGFQEDGSEVVEKELLDETEDATK